MADLSHEKNEPVDPQGAPGVGPKAAADDFYPLAKVRVGEKDKRGREILDVLWAVPDFKIFKTEKGISPHFSDDEKIACQQMKRYLELGAELAHLNHLIQLMSRKRVWRMVGLDPKAVPPPVDSYLVFSERETARAIAQALTGNEEKGKLTLNELAARLEKRLRNKGRVIYFAICLGVSLGIGVAAFAVFVILYLYNTSLPFHSDEVLLAAVMGSAGALLSTAAGLRGLRIDASASMLMNWVYGGQRMLVGVLGAIVLYLAVRAGILLEMVPGIGPGTGVGAFGEGNSIDLYKLSFLSVLAGFSERLVPNLLDRSSEVRADTPASSGDSP
jgi:hypothetical protein